MTWSNHEIAAGHDNIAGLVNLETYFPHSGWPTRVPMGSVTRTMLDRARQTNGARPVIWRMGFCEFAQMEDYIDSLFGGFNPTSESVPVTLRWRGRDNAFHYHNGMAHFPRDGEHYQHEMVDLLLEVRLEFDILDDLPDPE